MSSLGQALPENEGDRPGADETFGKDRGPSQMQFAGERGSAWEEGRWPARGRGGGVQGRCSPKISGAQGKMKPQGGNGRARDVLALQQVQMRPQSERGDARGCCCPKKGREVDA